MSPDICIEIPPAWERITLSALHGVVLVVGAPDTGKSTFARYLYSRLCACHERVAFVDGDVGQAVLGPPTTMTLTLGMPGDNRFPPAGPRFRVFVGDVTPRRHMLPVVVGAHRLVNWAREEGAVAIVFDSTGLVDPAQGGGALKRAKVDLLRPVAVVGIQRGSELEYLLVPLRRSHRTRVIDLRAAPAAFRREVPARRAHRVEKFRRTFEGARNIEVEWRRLAVFPAPTFSPHRLVGLEDSRGFVLGLGIVMACDLSRGTVTVHTPLASMDGVDAIRLGDLTVDPDTYHDRPGTFPY
jgi:polynucleotide 5'-hydroxyl-kinase GRC3/NOL9